MFSRLAQFAICPILLTAGAPAWAAEREAGLPFLRNYAPKDYGQQAKNWAVAQDQRGVVYIGNNDGVLIYDGARWQTVRMPNNSAVHSLDVDASGTVYVGARGEFGFLTPGKAGAIGYESLLTKVPGGYGKFGNVTSTLATPQGVVFSSSALLFRWNREKGMQVWRPPPRRAYRHASLAGNALYVQSSVGTLLHLDGDLLKPAPGGDRFTKDHIYCVSLHQGKLLVGSKEEGMFLQEGSSFKPFPTEADALLRHAEPHSCRARPGGGWVIATDNDGAILLSQEGRLERILDERSGLFSDQVNFAYPDREGGIWLAMVFGVARADVPSPLSYFDKWTGLKGMVSAITRHDDALYAGTSAGLFRIKPAAPGRPARFESVAEFQDNAVWSLLSTQSGLLISSADGVYQLHGKQVRLIPKTEDFDMSDLTPSPRDPALVYGTGAGGLVLLREKGGRWSKVDEFDDLDPVKKAMEDASGRLWLGTETGSVQRVDFSATPPIETFGERHGLPADWTYPSAVAGRVVFLSSKGILRFEEATRRFSPDPVFTPLFAKRSEYPSVLVEDRQGNVWAGAKTYGVLWRRRTDGSYRWDDSPLRRMTGGEVYAAHVDADGVAWAGTFAGIVRYNPVVPKNYVVQFPALIRRVSGIDGKMVHFAGAGQPARPSLTHQANSLRFEFAAPTFEDESRTEYRVFLDSFDSQPSTWTTGTHKDYTNLPKGSYKFRVEARNLYGAISQPGDYELTVLPPWYSAWWLYGLAVVAGAGLVWAVVQWRLRVLAEHNRRLQQLVDQRTAELREKNLKLTELNAEKNNFLGIAAHDLKNPLGAIRGYAEMLEEDSEDFSKDEVADTASRIKKSANLMFDLVSNLLDVNRIEQGKMDLNLAPCDLWETVRQAVEGYRQRAQAKRIELHFDGQTRTPLVMADAAQLVQIMDNLVSNAVKYSPAGKNIYVRVRQVDSGVRAEVQDEGPGISEADRKRLFGKFVRLSARPTAGESSTGLGLAIVKRLVESMNGKVWCESEPGQGATFLVELPVG
jgi:signal transduction histidine kinase/ligand-binding sensor domain-containing protein